MSRMLLAYFGPETVLPITSLLAAIGGVVLMFGRQSFRLASYALRRLGRLVGFGRTTPQAPAAAGRLRRERAARARTRRPAAPTDQVGS